MGGLLHNETKLVLVLVLSLGDEQWVPLAFALQPGCLFCARASLAAFGGGG